MPPRYTKKYIHSLKHKGAISNSCTLSDREIQVIKRELSKAEDALQKLIDKILQTEAGSRRYTTRLETHRVAAALERLRAQYRKSTAHIMALRVAIAPHKRLPIEVLSYIFLQCLEGRAVRLPPPARPTSPWVLRQICSKWREIVVNDPRLWNCVEINTVPSIDRASTAKILELVTQVLPRSGTLSISLVELQNNSITQLSAMHWPPPPQTQTNTIINSIIKTNVTRLRELRLSVGVSYILECFKYTPKTLPPLESLDLHILAGNNIPQSEKPISADITRSIRRLRISGYWDTAYRISNILHVPWHQLTDLDLSETPLTDYRPRRNLASRNLASILQQCSNLINCALAIDFINLPWSKIVLPHLRSLMLVFSDERLFQYFTLPSLRILHLANTVLFSKLAPEIIAMIQRSSCTLETIIHSWNKDNSLIKEDGSDPKLLEDLFAATPSLNECRIPDTALSESTMERIANGSLLPGLVAITCFVHSVNTFANMIETLLQDREPSTRLRQAIGVYDGLYIDAQAISRMERIQQVYGPSFTLEQWHRRR